MSIVVIGSLNIDKVLKVDRLPLLGETIVAERAFIAAGGKGANQAAAAARMGAPVAMIGHVGSDAFGEFLVEELQRVGCDCSDIMRVAGTPTGCAYVAVANDGANSIIVDCGANALMTPQSVERAAKSIASASIVLLQLEIASSATLAGARLARRNGAVVIVDPAPAGGTALGEIMREADILTPNAVEALHLLHGHKAPHSDLELPEIASAVRCLGPKTVILKLGAQGCLLFDGGEPHRISAPKVDAVDTTAAGDVFNGALAAALYEGANMEDACRFAVKAASLSVTRQGAQSSIPSRAEVDDFQPKS